MKKTFLAMLMAGCSCAVFAQEITGTLSTSSSYNAYGTFMATPPVTVQNYVVRDYPTATKIYWQQSSPDLWHGYYVTNGQPTHLYYPISFHVPTAATSFTVALPVRQTLVSEDVVAKSIELFGPTMYDINIVKGTNKQEVYVVRTLENGQLSSQYIDADGNRVLDIYRVETEDDHAAMTTDPPVTTVDTMNDDASKVKIKTKTSDGKETKTKMKNGKIKTKEF